MIQLIFNSLLGLNPDTALPYPDLATAVPSRENGGISQDGLTYTFKLRNDVKWHDGTQFTAKDVVYTYTTMQKKELGSQRTTELNDRVESITATDDYTVVFKLKKIVAPFLTSNMYCDRAGAYPQGCRRPIRSRRTRSALGDAEGDDRHRAVQVRQLHQG